MTLCECGCGQTTTVYNGKSRRFITGHNWVGKKHSPETIEKMKKPRSKETCEKISKSMTGHIKSEETCIRLSNSKKGKYIGENSCNWKGGITPLGRAIRTSLKYEEWSLIIKDWDNYTCQKCGVVGGELHSHHIKRFSELFGENNISSIEQALQCEPLWDVSNGITYCEECHKLLGTKGGLL